MRLTNHPNNPSSRKLIIQTRTPYRDCLYYPQYFIIPPSPLSLACVSLSYCQAAAAAASRIRIDVGVVTATPLHKQTLHIARLSYCSRNPVGLRIANSTRLVLVLSLFTQSIPPFFFFVFIFSLLYRSSHCAWPSLFVDSCKSARMTKHNSHCTLQWTC